jgi:hypothetical protein
MSTGLAQGDLRLPDSEVAQRLLSSTIPARLAYVATDGTPRVIATWFSWTGEELVISTFLAAPHVHRPATRLGALRTHLDVAVTIDTDSFPPLVLTVRGRVSLTEVHGLTREYDEAARRYLGEAAALYLAQIDQPVPTCQGVAGGGPSGGWSVAADPGLGT